MTRSLRAVAIAAATATSLTLGLAVAGAQTTEPAAESIPTVPSSSPPDATAPVPSAPVNSAPLTTLSSPSLVSDGVDEDLVELARLSEEAGALGEELHLAREELDRATRERDRLERAAGVAASRSALADGVAQRDQSTVDQLATMRYRGGDTGATRAAVLAESPRDLVHRLDALRRLSGATTIALDVSRAASREAVRLREDATRSASVARDAARDAQERTDDLARRSEEMRGRMDEVRRRVDALSDAQRARWAGGPVMPEGYVAPPVDDVNSAALRVALSRLGAPYSWGATGPSEFDCSGLMVWAYAREGKTLPRSSQAQAVAGAPVAMADIRPGDLVIYFPGATHVGMYAGDGLVLHAPTYGVPVRLERADAMPIHGIRRY
ncbi:NlpC/P60 family protein [Dietzia sp. B32]|uniref:NlpC/P60 family protein n=1 Tax=Dietzia sp. B32 TaxID=2915130 RepID=UPI0021AD513E|nr:NlpC/P60 family protein [Dietzia sp. B32]UVE95002.1 NlpC/P60 family protein [Dietzia sp. B32]